VRALLGRTGVEPGDRIEFVAAELTSDDNWAKAAEGEQ